MNYRRFEFATVTLAPATVATVRPSAAETVASVATVAGPRLASPNGDEPEATPNRAIHTPDFCNWDGQAWRAFFDERAALAEFDGELSGKDAERVAYDACEAEWLSRNLIRSPSGRCLHCGNREQGHDPLLPFGCEEAGHAWLHQHCWNAWNEARKGEAAAALASVGIKIRSIDL